MTKPEAGELDNLTHTQLKDLEQVVNENRRKFFQGGNQ